MALTSARGTQKVKLRVDAVDKLFKIIDMESALCAVRKSHKSQQFLPRGSTSQQTSNRTVPQFSYRCSLLRQEFAFRCRALWSN